MSETLTIRSRALGVAVEETSSERLGRLFDLHHQRLYRLALRLSRDADEARDLVQEAFLRAARRPASIPHRAGAAEAWMVRVLVNLCRDRWRKLKVRREAGPIPAWSQRSSADPEAAARVRQLVRDALQHLRPRTRAVVVMHEIEGRSKADIARQLGISEVTVRWHLATGRSRIARLIEP